MKIYYDKDADLALIKIDVVRPLATANAGEDLLRSEIDVENHDPTLRWVLQCLRVFCCS